MQDNTNHSAGELTSIEGVAQFIEKHVRENWKLVLETKHAKLMDAYARGGDSAYGTYLELLFQPVHRRFKELGIRVTPRLPGKFDISREWGNAQETDQQRWMWSTVMGADGKPIGTIVTITHHDHSGFRVPRAPGVFGIHEVGNESVVAALSKRSRNFKRAREAKIEIAEYLASLENQGGMQ